MARTLEVLTAALVLLLTACGGGAGSPSDDTPSPQTTPRETGNGETAGAIEIPAESPCPFVDRAMVEVLLGDPITFEDVNMPGEPVAPHSSELTAPAWSCFYQGEQYSYDSGAADAFASTRVWVTVGGAPTPADWERSVSLHSQNGECTPFPVEGLGDVTFGADCVRSGAIRSVMIGALYPETTYRCAVERETAGAPEDLQQQLIHFCVGVGRAAAAS